MKYYAAYSTLENTTKMKITVSPSEYSLGFLLLIRDGPKLKIHRFAVEFLNVKKTHTEVCRQKGHKIGANQASLAIKTAIKS